jgi:hypothetical protein
MPSRRPAASTRLPSGYAELKTRDEDDERQIVQPTTSNNPILWLAIVILSVLLAGNLWQQRATGSGGRGSYEKGFKTELGQRPPEHINDLLCRE